MKASTLLSALAAGASCLGLARAGVTDQAPMGPAVTPAPAVRWTKTYPWQTASWQTYPWQTASWQSEPWQTASWQTKPWQTASWQTQPWQTASWQTNPTQTASADHYR